MGVGQICPDCARTEYILLLAGEGARDGEREVARRLKLTQPAVCISVRRGSISPKKKEWIFWESRFLYFYGRPLSPWHILGVLEMTGGQVGGRNGAAQLLKLNPSTFRQKMRRLHIPFGKKANLSSSPGKEKEGNNN